MQEMFLIICLRLHHNSDPADQNDRVRLDTTAAGVDIHGLLQMSLVILSHLHLSDERLKTNISPISDALSKVKSINGFTYNWNDKAKELLDMNTTDSNWCFCTRSSIKVVPEVIKTRKEE